jgi:hypothetical protein
LIWPGRRRPELDAELPARAEAAARRFAGGRTPSRGGLTGVIARALGLRRRSAPDEPADAGADTAEVQMLREELARELEGAARRRAVGGTRQDVEPASTAGPADGPG